MHHCRLQNYYGTCTMCLYLPWQGLYLIPTTYQSGCSSVPITMIPRLVPSAAQTSSERQAGLACRPRKLVAVVSRLTTLG